MDVAEVKQAMHSILLEKLHGVKYSSDASATACREIAESIKTRLLAIDSTRYKYIVEVQILEKRGGGFRTFAKCYWDSERDRHVEEVYQNESFMCVAVVFAIAL